MKQSPVLSPLPHRLRRLRYEDESYRAWERESTTDIAMYFVGSRGTSYLHTLSRTSGSARPSPFAARYATTNITVHNLPPTPTYAPPRSYPANTPRTAVAGQPP